jgi:ERCC4-related helicase
MTPETLRNDMDTKVCPINKLVLLVFDEAHRATGNYAYCEIIRILKDCKAVFRVLALSATPGGDTKKVQQVVDNLLIQKLELRTEDSFDVRPFVHRRDINEILVQPSVEMQGLVSNFGALIQPYLKKLVDLKAFNQDNPLLVHSYFLINRRDLWRKTKSNLPQSMQSTIEGYFAITISLITYLNKLMGWGIKAFYDDLQAFDLQIKQSPNPSKLRLAFSKLPQFTIMMAKLSQMVRDPNFSSHPKMDQTLALVLDHFQVHAESVKNNNANGKSAVAETRVMIFASYRSSVEEIVQRLAKHAPIVRPAAFIGQSTGKTSGKIGLKQKQQLQVINDFKCGKYNVLCSTSIGEEGLDIGDIDLIICFDVSKSPIQMLQRSGRTGRKRQGKIYMLLCPGSDENSLQKARSKHKSVQNSIQASKINLYGGLQAGILPNTNVECIKQYFEIKKVPETTEIKKKGKTKQNYLLDPERAELYAEKYFIQKVDVSLENHPHWQTAGLKQINIPHGEKTTVFTALMDYFEKLREKEALDIHDAPKLNLSYNSGPTQKINDPRPNHRRDSKRKMQSKLTCILSSECSDLSWLENDLHAEDKRKLHPIHDDIDQDEHIVGNNPRNSEYSLENDDVSCHSIENDLASAEFAALSHYQSENINSDSKDYKPDPSLVSLGSMKSHNNPIDVSSDYGSIFDDLDLSALREIDNCTLPQPHAQLSQPKGLGTPSPANYSSPIGKILSAEMRRPKTKRRRLVVSSSSPAVNSSKFLKKAQQEKAARREEILNEFFDREAEVSGSDVSSDEPFEADQDLSGFVVNSFVDSPVSVNDHGFYRRVALTPIGNQGYKFQKGYVPGARQHKTAVSEDDLPSSLQSFIVKDDEEIIYQTQIMNDPLMFDEISEEINPKIAKQGDNTRRNHRRSSSDILDSTIELDDIDLESLVDLE